jgi:hypothetical protein
MVLKSLAAYIGGGIAGIWSGLLVYVILGSLGTWLVPQPACSGFLCGTTLLIILFSGTCGGICGSVTGYLTPQYILQKPPLAIEITRYALLGSILWLIIGVITFIVVAVSGIEHEFGFELGSAIILSAIGVIIGFTRFVAATKTRKGTTGL